MQSIFKFLKNIDRRVIYVAMFLCVILPLLMPLNLKVKPSSPAKALFNEIEKLGREPGDTTSPDPGHKITLSFDYKPSAYPEVQPMAVAIIYHCFSRGIKVIAPALWAEGSLLATEAFQTTLANFPDKKYGRDYANLGYCAGPTLGHQQVSSLCTDLKKALPVDLRGNPYDTLPILKGVRSLQDVPLLISLSSGDPGIPAWVEIAYSRYGVKIAGGATAVQAPQFYPYIQARQLFGFLGGLRGAAEYEQLLQDKFAKVAQKKGLAPTLKKKYRKLELRKGLGSAGMDSQSFAHLLIMVLIIIANTMFLLEKYRNKNKS